MNVAASARVCVPLPLGCNAKTVSGDVYFNVFWCNCRLPGSGSGSSLSELQFLAASRRAAAAAAGAVLPPGAPGAAGATGAAGGGVAVPPPPPPHHPPGPDFHPAYRLNPYMEHLYSSLQQHSSPAASIHG